jgi:hypothetical protein
MAQALIRKAAAGGFIYGRLAQTANQEGVTEAAQAGIFNPYIDGG